MMTRNYTYREMRTRTAMRSVIPIFIDTNTTKTPNYLHHASLYGITEEEAQLQMRIGNTKNRKLSHYSSELVIDTDNTETAERVWEKLCENNYYFELYKLNNYKFFLQRDESDKPSDEMCYQDKQFVHDFFRDCNVNNGLDENIYNSPFHICRTKGSVHEVTGKKTQLVEIYKGSNLVTTNQVEVRKFIKPMNYKNPIDINSNNWDAFKVTVDLCLGVRNNKHITLWQFAKDLRDVCSLNTVVELGMLYAKSLNYDEDKCIRALRQGYGVE